MTGGRLGAPVEGYEGDCGGKVGEAKSMKDSRSGLADLPLML